MIPTYNECDNVQSLVDQLRAQLRGADADIIFVDDSSDGTGPAVISAAAGPGVPVRVIQRSSAVGELAGAVVAGILMAGSPWIVVMDGDLQHPPEGVHRLMRRARSSEADLVIASRYMKGGGTPGLSGPLRQVVSRASTVVAKGLFPLRLRGCSDPMTGFFAVRRSAIRVERLTPSGFKILLQLLLTTDLSVSEVPLTLGRRAHGESKASIAHGLRLVRQLAACRLGLEPSHPLSASVNELGPRPESELARRLISLGVPPGPKLHERRGFPSSTVDMHAAPKDSAEAGLIRDDVAQGTCDDTAGPDSVDGSPPGQKTHTAAGSRRVGP